MVENSLMNFHKSIDDKINMYEKEKQLLYVVIDGDNDIKCPDMEMKLKRL